MQIRYLLERFIKMWKQRGMIYNPQSFIKQSILFVHWRFNIIIFIIMIRFKVMQNFAALKTLETYFLMLFTRMILCIILSYLQLETCWIVIPSSETE